MTAILKDFDIEKTSTKSVNNSFIDIDLGFKRNPITEDVSIKVGNRAVAQAIRTIVMTNPGDLPNEPDFGVGVNTILGENYDPISILELKETIKEQITQHETRVELVDIQTSFEDHGLHLRIIYIIKNNPVEESIDIIVGRVL